MNRLTREELIMIVQACGGDELGVPNMVKFIEDYINETDRLEAEAEAEKEKWVNVYKDKFKTEDAYFLSKIYGSEEEARGGAINLVSHFCEYIATLKIC